MATMKVEIVNIETIKPSCPTPVHLKTYNMSYLDQIAVPFYTQRVFIYRNNNVDAPHYDHFSQTLKNSLSATLTLFPLLAGKIKDNVSVDCNDDGVQCYETRVHSTLDQLLLHPDLHFLHRLTVSNDEVNVLKDGQIYVKINLFNCGGIALGLSYSHKLCDATSFFAFFKSWSAKAINSIDQVIVPNLTAASTILPPRKDFFNIGQNMDLPSDFFATPTNELITTRLVFDGPKVDALKAKSAIESTTPHPTRVEVVTALMVKCAIAASKTNNKTYSSMSSYMVYHVINMRKMLAPSLPETTFGNVVGTYRAFYSEQSDGEACLDILVDKLRKARMDYCDSVAPNNAKKTMDGLVERMETVAEMEKMAEMVQSGDVERYFFTSWCRMGLYEADFGMGKPIWMGIPAPPVKNFAALFDTKDGNGIEAQLTLTGKDMAIFQANPLLLQYASVNPAV